MNKIYRLVWNKVRNCWMAVAEIAKACGKDKSICGVSAGVRLAVSAAVVFAVCPWHEKPVFAEEYTAGNGIVISGNTVSAKAGSNVSVDSGGISVVTNGAVTNGNTGVIKGGTLYSEVRPAANGTFVYNSNTTGQNLLSLDAAVKNAVNSLSASGNTITYTKADGSIGMVTLDGGSANGIDYYDNTHGMVALDGVGGTVVTGVAAGEVSAGSSDAVNGSQLYATQQSITNLESDISSANATVSAVQADVSALTGTVSVMNSTLNTVKTEVEAGFDVNIDGSQVKNVNPDSNSINFKSGSDISLTNDGGSVKISVNPTGTVASGNTNAVSGGAVYTALNAQQTAMDTALDTKANKDASNLSASDAVNWGNAVGTGTVAAGDSKLVTGNTVYTALNAQQTETDAVLATKANADASNVDAQIWANKIGTGTVAGGDGKLVTGNTVYTALNAQQTATDAVLVTKANADASNVDAQTWANKIGTGTVAGGDGKLVTGNTVYTALNAQQTATDAALATKANADASNVDAQTWANKIGTGTVSASDTKLVTGQTVYEALHDPGSDIEVNNITVKKLTGDEIHSRELYSEKATIDELHTDSIESNMIKTHELETDTIVVNGEGVFKDKVAFKNEVNVEGQTNLHNTDIDGKLTVHGTAKFEDNTEYDKNVTIGKDLTVEGKTNLKDTNVDGKLVVDGEGVFIGKVTAASGKILGDFQVDGNEKVLGTFETAGKATFGNDVEIQRNLSVDGTTTTERLVVEDDAAVGGDLTVDGKTVLHDTDVNGVFRVSDKSYLHDTNIDGDLSVDGDGSVTGDFTADGKVTAGELHVLEDAKVDGDIDVVGKSTLRDDVNAKQNVIIGKNLTVDGRTNLHDTNVDGDFTATGDGSFGKDLSVAGDTEIGKDLLVNGDTILKDTTVNGDLEVNGNQHVTGDATFDGALTAGSQHILGDSKLDGKLEVGGTADFKENVTVEKALDVQGNLSVTGDTDLQDANIHGDLGVDGDTVLKGALEVQDDASFEGEVSIAGNETVTGKSTVGSQEVLGDSRIDGNQQVVGDLSVNGNTSLKDTNINGKLNVTGNTVFDGDTVFGGRITAKDNVNMEKDLTVDGTSNLNGDTNIGGALDVAGPASFYDNAEFDKDVSAAGNLTVGGTSEFAGKVTAKDDVEVQKNLDVKGDSNVDGNAAVGGNLSVVGTSDLKGDVTIGGDLYADNGTSYFDKSIWHEGEEHQVEINETGIRVGLNSTHIDAHGVYAGGHDWDEAKAAMHEDGRIKGIYGNLEKDLTVGGKADVGSLEVQGDATVKGNFAVEGDSVVGGSQIVSKDFAVGGDSIFNGNVTMAKNLEVQGDVNVAGVLAADHFVVGGKDVGNEIDRLDNRIDKVGAQSAALANLRPMAPDEDHKFSFAAAYGGYKSEKAGAVGIFYNPSSNVQISASSTVGNSENMYGAGIAWQFGGNRKAKALKAENANLTKAVNYLLVENQKIKDQLDKLNLVQGKLASFPDVPKEHWANNAVETLHGNGFVQGYPDGEFKGDRQMTRYEYAEMLYNALSRGAKVDAAHLQEYAPELRQIRESQVR